MLVAVRCAPARASRGGPRSPCGWERAAWCQREGGRNGMVAWRRHLSLAHIPICGGKGTRGGSEGATPINLQPHCTMSASFSWFPLTGAVHAVLNIVQAQVSSFESAHCAIASLNCAKTNDRNCFKMSTMSWCNHHLLPVHKFLISPRKAEIVTFTPPPLPVEEIGPRPSSSEHALSWAAHYDDATRKEGRAFYSAPHGVECRKAKKHE